MYSVLWFSFLPKLIPVRLNVMCDRASVSSLVHILFCIIDSSILLAWGWKKLCLKSHSELSIYRFKYNPTRKIHCWHLCRINEKYHCPANQSGPTKSDKFKKCKTSKGQEEEKHYNVDEKHSPKTPDFSNKKCSLNCSLLFLYIT